MSIGYSFYFALFLIEWIEEIYDSERASERSRSAYMTILDIPVHIKWKVHVHRNVTVYCPMFSCPKIICRLCYYYYYYYYCCCCCCRWRRRWIGHATIINVFIVLYHALTFGAIQLCQLVLLVDLSLSDLDLVVWTEWRQESSSHTSNSVQYESGMELNLVLNRSSIGPMVLFALPPYILVVVVLLLFGKLFITLFLFMCVCVCVICDDCHIIRQRQ